MTRRISGRPSRRPLTTLTVGLLALGAATAAALPAAAATPGARSATVASGDGWTVTRGAAGYAVSLPARHPAADQGRHPGTARRRRRPRPRRRVRRRPHPHRDDHRPRRRQGLDDRLAVVDRRQQHRHRTHLPHLRDRATPGPAQDPGRGSRRRPSRPAKPGGSGSTPADPTTVGTGTYTVADYDFGTQSIPLADIGGIRGELEGRIYLPSGRGTHPLVIFLHGRHSACYNTTTLKGASGWPCPAGTTPILSYAGYDGAGEALAADGYTVVSISANAINANDNQLSPDDGAVTRGQLVLDTLTMLKAANSGQQGRLPRRGDRPGRHARPGADRRPGHVSRRARSAPTSWPGPWTSASIGLMGHSRGGEGVVTAGTLNEALPHPWSIKSVFALAPIDFTRATLPDVITTTLLPYCDGDVSDQQGQHFYADSRDGTFTDDVLRSNIWVMGTDHDFYNTSWTPPYPAASDDWSKSDDPVCGTSATALASGQNIRLTAAQQYQVGSAYIAGFFEATLGRQTAFQGLFDGSGQEPPSVSGFADVRTVAQQPRSDRADLTTFKAPSPLVTATGDMTATVCANKYGRTVPEALPYCTNPGSTLTNQQVPYWTPANYAPNVPLNPMTHLTWTGNAGGLAVTVPSSQRDVTRYDEMTLDMSPDESVTTGTDLTLTVADASGRRWSAPVSTLNPWAVNRMPASTSTNLGKIVLQQVHVPTSTLRKAGLDLRRLASVRLTPAAGPGGAYVSDLGFDRKALGTPHAQQRSTVNVASTTVEEGSAVSTDHVAVYLSQPSAYPISAYLTVLGSATTGALAPAMAQVTFRPGETCQAVAFPVTGDTLPERRPPPPTRSGCPTPSTRCSATTTSAPSPSARTTV